MIELISKANILNDFSVHFLESAGSEMLRNFLCKIIFFIVLIKRYGRESMRVCNKMLQIFCDSLCRAHDKNNTHVAYCPS
jgi:hypothetical protein